MCKKTNSIKSIVRVATVLVALLGAGTTAYAEKITLNFKDADIKAFITSVASITGKNFIVDPRVKGKITIISNRSLNKNEVYQVFLSVLEVHGYSAIPAGKTIKLVPDADAKHSAMPMVSDEKPGKGDQTVTRVIQIEHVTAAQLVPILRPLVPPQGHLAAYPQSNVLIISDRANNIDRLLKIIQRIDQPSSGEIEIVQLEYAAANDLVRVLTSLQQRSAVKGAKSRKTTLVADERTNSILIGGERAIRLQLRAIIAHLDTPAEVEGDTHVIYLRYAKAKDLVPVLTGVGDSKKQAATKRQGKGAASRSRVPIFSIQADESSNALVITAQPALFRSLESVIRKLDVRRAQVLIESIIAEVGDDHQADLGITWLWGESGKPGGVVDFTGAAGPAIAAGRSGTSNEAQATALVGMLSKGATLGFGSYQKDSFSWAGLIKALKTDTNTNVLSTPSLVTLDNEEAEIFVGSEVSIPKGSYTSTGSSSTPSNPFTTFDRVPIGISLKVKPQINEGDAIRLDIDQSIDDFKGDPGTAGIVTTSRKINTSVMVDDGKILVLGGLVRDNVVDITSKVPFLGDIPILGALFRSQSTQKGKTNLMIFLRPVILRTAAAGMALTNSKYKYIRDLQQQMEEEGVPLMLNEVPPVLPELSGFMMLPPPFAEAARQRQQILDSGDSSEPDGELFDE